MQKSTMLAAIFVNHRRAKTLDEALQILRMQFNDLHHGASFSTRTAQVLSVVDIVAHLALIG